MRQRREFPPKVMVDAFERAKGRCEKCSARLVPGKFQYDHRIPDAMGGEPTLENCVVLCSACHSIKTTTKDIPAIAKVKRIRRKHIGAEPKARGFYRPPGIRFDWKLGRNVKEAT